MSKSWISPPAVFPFYFESFAESSCISTAEDTAPEPGRHIPKWASYSKKCSRINGELFGFPEL
jgi:hypothetical protein